MDARLEHRTVLWYDVSTWPSIAFIASFAQSSSEKFTNPNPLDLPESLSMITFAVTKKTKFSMNTFTAWLQTKNNQKHIHNMGNKQRKCGSTFTACATNNEKTEALNGLRRTVQRTKATTSNSTFSYLSPISIRKKRQQLIRLKKCSAPHPITRHATN